MSILPPCRQLLVFYLRWWGGGGGGGGGWGGGGIYKVCLDCSVNWQLFTQIRHFITQFSAIIEGSNLFKFEFSLGGSIWSANIVVLK